MSPRLIRLLAALSGLCSCAPLPERYLNSVHPEYGAAQFVADVGLCRDRASTEVVSTLGGYYPPQSTVEVDEASVLGCMARHGWRSAPPSVRPVLW
jgi:hypothetical protein